MLVLEEPIILPPAGWSSYDIPLPSDPSLALVPVFCQGLLLDAANPAETKRLTNMRELVIF